MKKTNKYCLYCGQMLPNDAAFCWSCGKAQPSITPPPKSTPAVAHTHVPAPVATVYKKPARKVKPWPLTRAILLFVMSIALIVAAFLPVVSIETKIGEDVSTNVKVSPAQVFLIFSNSFNSIDNDDFFDEIEDLVDNYDDELEDVEDELEDEKLSKASEKLVSKIFVSFAKLGYQHEDVSSPAAMKAAACLFVIYLAVCIVFFVFSLLNLIYSIINPEKSARLYRVTVTSFALLPVLLIGLFYSSSAGLFHFFFGLVTHKTKLASELIIMLVLSFALLLALIICNSIMNAKTRETKIVPRIIAASAALLVVCSLFLPVATANIKTQFKGSEKEKSVSFTYDSTVFSALHITEDTNDYYDEAAESKEKREMMFTDTLQSFRSYTAAEARKGEANTNSIHYMMVVSSAYGLHEYWWAFALIPVIYVLVLISAGIILWMNLSCLAGGSYSRATAIVFKILTFIFAAAAVGAIIAFVLLQQFYIRGLDLSKTYAFDVHFGIYVMVILAFVGVFIPSRNFKRRTPPSVASVVETANEQPIVEESPATENVPLDVPKSDRSHVVL